MATEDFRALALVELDAVYRLAHAMTLDGTLAERLAIEVYRQALEHPPAGLAGRDLRRWLLRSLVKAHAALQLATGAASKKCPAPEQTMPPITPAQLADEGLDWITRALPTMTHHCRAVIVLWAVEGFTYREIAEILDEPVGTVTLWLQRARRHLSNKRAEAARGSD